MSKREGRNEKKITKYKKYRGRARAVKDVSMDALRSYRRPAYYNPKDMKNILQSFNKREDIE